ncbi:BTB/POZ protein [Rhizophagus irregularis DAOM 181602=DAOM 197198]|nr:BTB/POZ protein [Rhizophagus irregularis DAOM 181602=DAOM 197198]
MILRYIYGGRLSLEEYDTSDIIKILIASNELGLQELTNFKNGSFLELQNFCIELMSKEPEKIFNSIDFTSLSEKCLISFIQHDNVQTNVIQVWKHLLKWGIAQNPGFPSDPSNYSKEFLVNVYPYKKVLSKELRENLIIHFINQPMKPKITKEENIDNYTLSRVINKYYAINNCADYGPLFGEGDLTLCGNNCFNESYCFRIHYDKPIRNTDKDFSVEEYEVFQIMKD